MFLAKHQPFQLRNTLLNSPKIPFLRLMDQLDQNKLEYFINYFYSNFIYEKKQFFNHLKNQIDYKSIIVSDLNNLEKKSLDSIF